MRGLVSNRGGVRDEGSSKSGFCVCYVKVCCFGGGICSVFCCWLSFKVSYICVLCVIVMVYVMFKVCYCSVSDMWFDY